MGVDLPAFFKSLAIDATLQEACIYIGIWSNNYFIYELQNVQHLLPLNPLRHCTHFRSHITRIGIFFFFFPNYQYILNLLPQQKWELRSR